jgi:hypothetical protein
MAKVGQVVTIPTGSCCNITLDSGEKIIVNHEPGGCGASAGARLTVDRLKLMGFSSEKVVQIDLDTAEGKAALIKLTKGGTPGTPGPPIRLFIAYVQACASVADVIARCQQLQAGDEAE